MWLCRVPVDPGTEVSVYLLVKKGEPALQFGTLAGDALVLTSSQLRFRVALSSPSGIVTKTQILGGGGVWRCSPRKKYCLSTSSILPAL